MNETINYEASVVWCATDEQIRDMGESWVVNLLLVIINMKCLVFQGMEQFALFVVVQGWGVWIQQGVVGGPVGFEHFLISSRFFGFECIVVRSGFCAINRTWMV